MSRRVLICDDHPAMCWALEEMFKMVFPDAEIKTVCSFTEARGEILKDQAFDMISLDLNIPNDESDVFDLLPEIQKHQPNAKIIIITANCGHFLPKVFAKHGASALISKPTSPSEIISIIIKVWQTGEFQTCQHFAKRSERLPDNLTEREIQIAQLSAKGLSIADVAHASSITPQTVMKHRHNLLKKLGLNSCRQLALYFPTY